MRRVTFAVAAAVVTGLVSVTLSAAPTSKTLIISQANSPIEITAYGANYSAASGSGVYRSSEGIFHRLTYTNRSQQKVVAIRFGLVSFDVFNRFMSKLGGFSMDDLAVGKSEKSSWSHDPYSSFSFLSGVAYVDMVRLEDGTIWKADEATVLEELRKIEKDFDGKLLHEKTEPGK